MSDELARWAATRSGELIARAEAAAVAELRTALLRAASTRSPAAAAPARAVDQPIARTPASASTAASETPPPAATAGGERLRWTYCVAAAADRPRIELPGVGDSVTWVEHAGLAAAVSAVPATQFGEDVLPDALNDLDWLERIARAHEAVLERAGASATIVPLRLCTLFADDDGVRRMLDAHRGALTLALARLTDRQEWAVKLTIDPDLLEPVCDRPAVPERAGSGTAYLVGRRDRRDGRAAAERRARELAEDVHARLREVAVAATVRPPQRRELSGHVGEMLLNGAYLVERAAAGELARLVEWLERRHADVGARVELSGPLPPFNFTDLEPTG